MINSEDHPGIASALAAADKAATLLAGKKRPGRSFDGKGRGQGQAKPGLAQNLGAERADGHSARQAATSGRCFGGDTRVARDTEEPACAIPTPKARWNSPANYEEMLGDTVTAVELLRKAWRIDPNSKEVAEAFQVRGFRKVRDEWVLAGPEPGGRAAESKLETGRSRNLIGMTAEEARQRMGGKPNHV